MTGSFLNWNTFIEMNNFEPISNERLNKIKKDYKDLPK